MHFANRESWIDPCPTIFPGPSSFAPAIRLKEVHRQLNGNARALLVTGPDEHQYALKMIHHSYTVRMRASEALAGLLASRMGLPIAAWQPMIVENEIANCWPGFRSAPGGVATCGVLRFPMRHAW